MANPIYDLIIAILGSAIFIIPGFFLVKHWEEQKNEFDARPENQHFDFEEEDIYKD